MAATTNAARYLAMALVLAGVGYTALLCYAHTNLTPVTNSVVAVADGAIVLGALGLALWRAPTIVWTFVFAIAVNFLALALFADTFDLKVVRDVLVLMAFAVLGVRYADALAARTLFLIASAVIVFFCLLELFAPSLFTRLFDAFAFYASRGVLTPEQIQYGDSPFFVSGERGDGRLIAPWLTLLGSHRASSIFMEPVSLGNFGAIAAAFALSLPRSERRTAIVLGLVALITVFAADARFAAASLLLFLLARAAPLSWTNLILAVLPIASVALLIGVSVLAPADGDTFLGRLSTSGSILASFDVATLFGFKPYTVTTVDSGYAYAVTNFGLPLCLLIWAAFVAFPARNEAALRYKLLLGVYACALLCISGSSLFSLKTASLAWFAMGALAAQSFVAARERAGAAASPAKALPA